VFNPWLKKSFAHSRLLPEVASRDARETGSGPHRIERRKRLERLAIFSKSLSAKRIQFVAAIAVDARHGDC
jgi:hypothetical protein